MRLKIQPKLFRRSEVASKPKRGVSCNGTGPVNNFVNPTRRDANVLGQTILREFERLKEVIQEHLARMNLQAYGSLW